VDNRVDITIAASGGSGGGGNVIEQKTWVEFSTLTASDYNAGDTIVVYDSPYTVIKGVSDWNYYKNNRIVTPPPTTGWVGYNTSTAFSTSTQYGGIKFIETPSGNMAIMRAAPSTPYTITVGISVVGRAGLASCGPAFAGTSTTSG
jgi:hypothetical protein